MRTNALWTHLWNLKAPTSGLEDFRLDGRRADGWVLAFDDAGQPYRLHYSLEFEKGWEPRTFSARVRDAHGSRTLALKRDNHLDWSDGEGNKLLELSGCLDLDLWPTPFTNSPSIWRLYLALGECREIEAVFIEAPQLSIRRMRQAYTRLDQHHYLYQNLDGSGFEAVLTLGNDGLVERYPRFFQRQ
ncbi:putative glycolipid-binding domain-containing protein [Metapseudomonas boanensis]|uniref:Glycolipid-binding domain-containing protein n=1 Tax=Metapseudomonas boanensis TaxID=2822138 RepID=A0ABS5XB91_9GAMM|nr:putative glycolipid-binding domain-containing protein [Pseudomonas boanensis]MBT8764950.1 putative glycolipid-binding domain-containing protein [Pseudomonas boanensis]